MSTGVVAICNSALLKIGEERISSLSENNKRAKICNEQYEKIRDEVLRSHPWNFAIKRVQLAQLTTTPIFGFDYQYELPSDCLRVLRAIAGDSTLQRSADIRHQIEGNYLLANETSVKIQYIAKITDTTYYDSNFIEALALKIAADIAYPLVQSITLKQELLEEYREHVQHSRTYSGQEGTPQDFIEDYWLNARFGGVSYDEVQ